MSSSSVALVLLQNIEDKPSECTRDQNVIMMVIYCCWIKTGLGHYNDHI